MPRIIPSKKDYNELVIQPGDSVTIPDNQAVFAGELTSGNTDLQFFIPMSKPIVATSAQITQGGICARQANNYLVGGSFANPVSLTSGCTTSCSVVEGGVFVNCNRSWGGTNNTPVAVTPRAPITIAFS